MPVKQISITLENVPGKLSKVVDYLGENGINIIAVSVVDTTDFSVVRIIATDPEKASNVLRTHGYLVNITNVLAVEVTNRPEGLDAILKPLKEFSVNINYLYTCLRTGENTVQIVGVDEVVKAAQGLSKNHVHIFREEIYKL
jgi:hypothetical protein